jgi:uncharacterized alkaline shock family protein YloU
MHNQLKKLDAKEIELPETIFIRDIETKVFQSIVLQCLTQVQDLALVEGNLIDNLLGRDSTERVTGITVEQDQKSHSVKVKIEVNIAYGASIPDKAEELQLKITQDISRLTGLHVGSVHVVFKNLILKTPLEHEVCTSVPAEEYSDQFPL